MKYGSTGTKLGLIAAILTSVAGSAGAQSDTAIYAQSGSHKSAPSYKQHRQRSVCSAKCASSRRPHPAVGNAEPSARKSLGSGAPASAPISAAPSTY
jgi:hypothetical protein